MATANSEEGSTDLAIERTEMADNSTRWAADRTLWAADRTFIAWLRTAISMIGFGIAIGKAGDVLEAEGYAEPVFFEMQIMGVIFIVLAVIGLAAALVQGIRIERRLAESGYPRLEPVPLAQTMGVLVLAFGVLGGAFILIL